jgi:peptidoglycan-associated lipoprotein
MKTAVLIKSLILCLILSMALVGCAKKQVATTTTPTMTETTAPSVTDQELTRQAEQERLRQEALREEQKRTAAMREAVSEIETNLIYFEFDSFELKPESRSVLQRKAEHLKSYPSLRMTIEGHCDERGTEEYNLALGQRRAQAVADFLVLLGINANRLKTVSFGEERPAVTESNEAAWAKNRRAEFRVSS